VEELKGVHLAAGDGSRIPHLVLLSVVEQLANVVSSQDAGLSESQRHQMTNMDLGLTGTISRTPMMSRCDGGGCKTRRVKRRMGAKRCLISNRDAHDKRAGDRQAMKRFL